MYKAVGIIITAYLFDLNFLIKKTYRSCYIAIILSLETPKAISTQNRDGLYRMKTGRSFLVRLVRFMRFVTASTFMFPLILLVFSGTNAWRVFFKLFWVQ